MFLTPVGPSDPSEMNTPGPERRGSSAAPKENVKRSAALKKKGNGGRDEARGHAANLRAGGAPSAATKEQ